MLDIYSNTCLLSRILTVISVNWEREKRGWEIWEGLHYIKWHYLETLADPVLAWSNILTFLVAIVFVPADIFWCLMPFKIHFMSFLHWNAVQRL